MLVSLRDYQDGKCDVILKYNADEARQLKAMGHLPDNAKINATDAIGEDDEDEKDSGFVFDDI